MERAAEAATPGPGLIAFAAGLLTAILLLAVVRRMRRRHATAPGAGALWFCAVPALAYVVQEAVERALHGQLVPFPIGLEPGLALVVLVQAGFGLLAYLLARALGAAVRRIALREGRNVLPAPRDAVAFLHELGPVPRRLPLARDGPTRGPPPSVPA
jgi:hypothetical protein